MSRSNRKTITDGVINHVSASSLNLFRACRRAYALKYVAGIPGPPPKAGMFAGSAGHARLEKALKGEPVELTATERKALALVPETFKLVEYPIESPQLMLAGQIPVVGYIDLLYPADKHTVRIVDWKYKGDVKKWGTKKGELNSWDTEAGLQTMIYAAWAYYALGPYGYHWGQLTHVQLPTAGGRPVVVNETVKLVQAAHGFDKLGETVIQDLRVTVAQDPHKVRPNYKSCFRYGRCDYFNECAKNDPRFPHLKTSGSTVGMGRLFGASKRKGG